MKKRSLALWVVLFVALFVFLSGGAGCGGSSDSSYSESSSSISDEIIGDDDIINGGGGSAAYEDYEETWEYIPGPYDTESSVITISNVDGSDEGFTAHLEGGYTNSDGTTTDITGDYTFTRVDAEEVPGEFWAQWAEYGLTSEAMEAIFDRMLMCTFINEDGSSKGRVRFTLTDEQNPQVIKDEIDLHFIKGEITLVNEDDYFGGMYEKQ